MPPKRHGANVFGWIETKGGNSDWSRAVSEIAFSIEQTGDVSPVVVRPEGGGVRWIDFKPATRTPFEGVRPSLHREERARLRKQLEDGFAQEIKAKYSVETP